MADPFSDRCFGDRCFGEPTFLAKCCLDLDDALLAFEVALAFLWIGISVGDFCFWGGESIEVLSCSSGAATSASAIVRWLKATSISFRLLSVEKRLLEEKCIGK